MHSLEQRSDGWFTARLGCVTASRVADLMAKGRGGQPSASRANYAAQLVAERLTGEREQGFTSAAMQHGVDNEESALLSYAFLQGVSVAPVGFVPHPSIEWFGASPDGLVADDGLVEAKCPGTAKHIATLTGAPIDGRYIHQMQAHMACTGRHWNDFVSYDPRLPVEMQTCISRVPRDDEAIAEMEAAVSEFLADVSATVADLLHRFQKEAA